VQEQGEAAGWRPLRRPAAAALSASPFSRLAVAHALSVAGDALVTMALAGSLFFSISPNTARGRVALSLVLTVAPFALVAPFLGPAIDRRAGGRRAMVAVVAAARAFTALYMAAVIDRLLLFPAAFVYLVLSKTHAVAKSALVPGVVDSDEELVEANSRLALIGVVMGFVAAAPGVPVLKLFGGEWVLRLAAAVFAAASIAAVRITTARVESDDRAVHVFGRGPAAGSDDGAAGVRERGIRLAAIAMGGLRAAVGFLTFLIAFALRRGHAPAWLFGVALAASLGGTLVGAAAAPRLRRVFSEERLLLGCLVLMAAAGAVAARLPGRPASVVMAAAVGVGASAGKLAFDSLVQRDAPGAVRGRQFARFEAGFQLAWVAGALLPVVVHIPTRLGAVLLAAGAVGLCVVYGSGARGAAR
jgi:Na+/melibiose symporter-like transporter